MSKNLAQEGILILWSVGGDAIQVLDTTSCMSHEMTLPISMSSFLPLSKKEWFLEDVNGRRWLMKSDDGDVCPSILYPIDENDLDEGPPLSSIVACSNIGEEVAKNFNIPLKQLNSTLLCPSKDLAAIAAGFPQDGDNQSEIYTWMRDGMAPPHDPVSLDPSKVTTTLPSCGQVIRVVPRVAGHVSQEVSRHLPANYNFLEVTDLSDESISYVPLPRAHLSSMNSFLTRGRAAQILSCPWGDKGVATVDIGGGLRFFDTGRSATISSLEEWQKLIGLPEGSLRLEIEKKDAGGEASGPKHGKVDEKGDPHVGGNTWAGGSGGRDTAGLGGIGGPYRLDGGHDVHQVPQSVKDAVPEDVKKAAREMGEKAFKDRLREISMSPHDATLYGRLSGAVKVQTESLRSILLSLQAKSKERQWTRHRSEGDMDDLKLIEGIVGERNIYKQRREEEPEIGAPQTKPKRLRLVVDVSGSMYRFNGHDGRLQREIEATLMMLEAFEGFEDKITYEVCGHSGEEVAEPFVKNGKAPKNDKERLNVILTMQAHSQFCLSGDNTLEAMKAAVNDLKDADCDEAFVVLLSDANLDRYGIRPSQLTKIMTEQGSVNTFAVFLGTLGNQAELLKRALPAGKAFVCLDLKDLPRIMQTIFTQAVMD